MLPKPDNFRFASISPDLDLFTKVTYDIPRNVEILPNYLGGHLCILEISGLSNATKTSFVLQLANSIKQDYPNVPVLIQPEGNPLVALNILNIPKLAAELYTGIVGQPPVIGNTEGLLSRPSIVGLHLLNCSDLGYIKLSHENPYHGIVHDLYSAIVNLDKIQLSKSAINAAIGIQNDILNNGGLGKVILILERGPYDFVTVHNMILCWSTLIANHIKGPKTYFENESKYFDFYEYVNNQIEEINNLLTEDLKKLVNYMEQLVNHLVVFTVPLEVAKERRKKQNPFGIWVNDSWPVQLWMTEELIKHLYPFFIQNGIGFTHVLGDDPGILQNLNLQEVMDGIHRYMNY